MYLDPAVGMFAQVDLVVFFLDLEFSPWSPTIWSFFKSRVCRALQRDVISGFPRLREKQSRFPSSVAADWMIDTPSQSLVSISGGDAQALCYSAFCDSNKVPRLPHHKEERAILASL